MKFAIIIEFNTVVFLQFIWQDIVASKEIIYPNLSFFNFFKISQLLIFLKNLPRIRHHQLHFWSLNPIWWLPLIFLSIFLVKMCIYYLWTFHFSVQIIMVPSELTWLKFLALILNLHIDRNGLYRFQRWLKTLQILRQRCFFKVFVVCIYCNVIWVQW